MIHALRGDQTSSKCMVNFGLGWVLFTIFFFRVARLLLFLSPVSPTKNICLVLGGLKEQQQKGSCVPSICYSWMCFSFFRWFIRWDPINWLHLFLGMDVLLNVFSKNRTLISLSNGKHLSRNQERSNQINQMQGRAKKQTPRNTTLRSF